MSEANISKMVELISNNKKLFDSEQINFRNIIQEAQSLVSSGLGEEELEFTNSAKFYKHAFNLINTEFDTFIKSVENMRSSYLPSDVFNAIALNAEEEGVMEDIVNNSTPLESYQNAFFRMIGLPSWEDVIADTRNITLSIVDTDGELKDGVVSEQNVYTGFLDKRQAFSTIGCAASISHFDLVSSYISSSDFLKKQKNFSDEAISQIISFSDIISLILDVDKINNKDEYDKLIVSFTNYIGDLFRKELNGVNIVVKVKKIDDKNNVGDPFLWQTNSFDSNKNFDPDNFFDPALIKQNYFSYLLFIFYAFVGTNPELALNDKESEKIYKELVLGDASDDSLNNIEENIFTYSSLLFPLVKDGRISRCINDPAKIVADPFLPLTKRMVNKEFLKSSLLESIIRIRTDIISGSRSYEFGSDDAPYTLGEDAAKSVGRTEVSGQMLGYLESLLIVRMLDALESLAESTKRNIEQLSSIQRRTGKSLFGYCSDSKGSTLSAVPVADREHSKERIILNNYALIEDSILLLLGTKDIDQDSLSLQSNINRDSSIPNSYLMSSLVNLVQIPRKYISERIEEHDRKLKTQNSVGSKVAKDIEVAIGIRSGVGIVDLLAIIIALLTIDEVSLVSLLTTQQLDAMFLQINPDTFDFNTKQLIYRTSMGDSVNVLTERVHTVYQLFIDLLKD